MFQSKVFWVGALVLGFAACSSDDKGDGGGSGVDSNKKLSELTPAEATALCEAHSGSFQAAADKACIIGSLLTAADAASCETAVADCEAAVASGDAGTGAPADPCADAMPIAGCDATVADVEACEDELVAHLNALSCDDAGDPPPAPQCAVDLYDACPGALPGS